MVKLIAEWYNQSNFDPPYKTLQELAEEELLAEEEANQNAFSMDFSEAFS